MQSIEITNQIVNSRKKNNNIKGIGKRTQQNIKSYDELLKIKTYKEYLKGYNSTGYYYKAHTTQYLRENTTPILQEFNLNCYIFTSYTTDVFIYDNLNEIIIYNLDYYNSSRTTKNQIEYKINYSFFKYRQQEYYLKDNLFNELTTAIKEGQANKYYNMLDTLLIRVEKEKEALYQIETAIKEQKYLINNQQNKPETIKQLKTRNRHTEKFNIFNVPVIQEYSTNKKNNRIISKIKIKIDMSKQELYTVDLRSYKDKILFNGYDMGITNTKDLKRNY